MPEVTSPILALVEAIQPIDRHEATDRRQTLEWLVSTSDVFRIEKPNIPSKHLVSYFVLFDAGAQKILLVEHRKAGKWLPTGGHVEPGEHPAETVRRECQEELAVEATFFAEPSPFFVTVTDVHDGQLTHTDVSLWFVLRASESEPESLMWDQNEFENVQWWAIHDIMSSPIQNFDPELHRFCGKLQKQHGELKTEPTRG